MQEMRWLNRRPFTFPAPVSARIAARQGLCMRLLACAGRACRGLTRLAAHSSSAPLQCATVRRRQLCRSWRKQAQGAHTRNVHFGMRSATWLDAPKPSNLHACGSHMHCCPRNACRRKRRVLDAASRQRCCCIQAGDRNRQQHWPPGGTMLNEKTREMCSTSAHVPPSVLCMNFKGAPCTQTPSLDPPPRLGPPPPASPAPCSHLNASACLHACCCNPQLSFFSITAMC